MWWIFQLERLNVRSLVINGFASLSDKTESFGNSKTTAIRVFEGFLPRAILWKTWIWGLLSDWREWWSPRNALTFEQRAMNSEKSYTGCEMRTGYSGGRRRLTALRVGVSEHAPSTPENLVTNFSCEDLTSVSLGCVALRKNIIHKST